MQPAYDFVFVGEPSDTTKLSIHHLARQSQIRGNILDLGILSSLLGLDIRELEEVQDLTAAFGYASRIAPVENLLPNAAAAHEVGVV